MIPDNTSPAMSFALGTPFRLGSAGHVTALFAVVVWCAAMVLIGKGWKSTHGRKILSVAMSGALLGNELVWLAYRLDTSGFDVRDTLPLHLCDLAIIAVILALATRRRWAFEFAYFFGLGGAVQALATPNLALDFPDYGFIKFFISHGGIVAGVLYLWAAFGLRPTKGAVLRMFVAGNAYMAIAGAFNVAAGTNYGFLCEKPAMNSLLDYLGPWPWYLLSIEVLGTLLLIVFYAPFFFVDRMRSKARTDRTESS